MAKSSWIKSRKKSKQKSNRKTRRKRTKKLKKIRFPNELQIGKAGEHLVVADLILHGFKAFLADQGSEYDIVFQTKTGLKTIQVKTTRTIKTTKKNFELYRFSLRRGKGNVLRYEEKFDYFAFVALDINKIGYIKFNEILNKKGVAKTFFELRDKERIFIGRSYSGGKRRKRFGRFIQDYYPIKEELIATST